MRYIYIALYSFILASVYSLYREALQEKGEKHLLYLSHLII